MHLEILLLLLVLLLFAVVGVVVLLGGLLLLFFWHLDLLDWSIWVNTKLLGHEPVHTADKSRSIGKLIAGLNESSLEEHLSSAAGGSVALTCLDLGQQVHDHRVIWVDLQSLAASHHGELVLVLEG